MSIYGTNLFGESLEPARKGKIADDFLVPPFSVLNAREGWWQERKRAWLALGIESEVGRSAHAFDIHKWMDGADENQRARGDGTSIFDPVLTELLYRWFTPANGAILDPFAGGSVRGVVASLLGRSYTGIDLRPEQIESNEEQAGEICDDPFPVWLEGDARHVRTLTLEQSCDFLFTCPPYGNLEVYSDDPRDLSAMSDSEFLRAYRRAISESCSLLKPNRFACFVVGDYRDSDGNYCNLPGETVRAFHDAGLQLYNEAILITSVGSLPIRIGKQFRAGRKLGKTHQNVLVFVKGDGKRAAGNCAELGAEMDLW